MSLWRYDTVPVVDVEDTMANKNLFQTSVGKLVAQAAAHNNALAPAYALKPKHALAQLAATGCLSSTFYTDAGEQLEQVLALCSEVDTEWIARTAVYARKHGYTKDMPALLCAVLATRDSGLLRQIFHRVIDNGRMLRNFVQIMRSGTTGRKSLGTLPKKLVLEWLEAHSDEEVFFASVGNSPSLADVIKMVHPCPATPAREALYGYLLGRRYNADALPAPLRAYEAFKEGDTTDVPHVPFQMLTSLPLSTADWCAIARNAGWQTTRMNLNTFARHGVFSVDGMTELVAERLRDADAIAKAKVLPYQLLAAYKAANSLPQAVVAALHDAVEIAVANVPAFEGRVFVCPDVSGSMCSPVTGYSSGAASAVRCVDVAALVAAAVLRRNPEAVVLPFADHVVKLSLKARGTILKNAQKLAAVGGGGTDCSAPLAWLNKQRTKGDLVVFISDNESWIDARKVQRGTAMMREWDIFKGRNPNARLVCIDIAPNTTTQAVERKDILNIGGFSDHVFSLIAGFTVGEMSAHYWMSEIEKIRL